MLDSKEVRRFPQEHTPNQPTHRIHLESRPSPLLNDLTTPGKRVAGAYYNSNQYETPTSSQTQTGLHASPRITPRLTTPSSTASGSSRKSAASNYFTPTSQISRGYFATPSSRSQRSSTTTSTPASQKGSYGKPLNPFDFQELDALHKPVFSPNVFAQVVDPDEETSTPRSFKWSIEQLAILHPADIEEMPLQQDAVPKSLDPEVEERAQKAIDKYFETHMVPSPWTDSDKKKQCLLLQNLLKTPGSQCGSPFADQKKDVHVQEGKDTVACQTTLTIPADVDLQEILGKYYTHSNQNQDHTSGDVSPDGSNSSLRRKLFFHGDIGTPLSPVSGAKRLEKYKQEEFCMSPYVSPVKCGTPVHARKPPMSSPSANQFSSSPIRPNPADLPGHLTPSLRRCSTAPDLMSSPLLSPIGTGHRHMSDKGVASSLETPSNVPFQATPSTGARQSLPFGSPGMSPIAGMNGSYIPDSYTGLSDKKHGIRTKITPAPPELSFGNDSLFETDHHYGNNWDMETDSHMEPKEDGFYLVTESEKYSTETKTLESSFERGLWEDKTYDSHQYGRSPVSSQDTGYHTSMGSSCTNQDTGLHTNITKQFGDLHAWSQHETGIDTDDDCQSMLDEEGDTEKNKVPFTSISSGHVIKEILTQDGVLPKPFLFGNLNDKESVERRDFFQTNESRKTDIDRKITKQTKEILGHDISYGDEDRENIDKKAIFNNDHPMAWLPPDVATPHKEKFKNLVNDIREENGNEFMKPSDFVMKALQRAESDLSKY